LKSIPKLTFDLDRELHPLVKDILETLKLRISIQDLKDLEFGTYFNPDIYDVYIKLLRLFNQINLDAANLNGNLKNGRSSNPAAANALT
jgi:hypothetical protein